MVCDCYWIGQQKTKPQVQKPSPQWLRLRA